jgi:hypothetical protein
VKARVLSAGETPLEGMVLARGAGPLQKGAVLSAADAELLRGKELHVLEMEAGDVHEEAAGRRLATAVAGEGVAVGPLEAGSWPLAARHRGIVEVDAQRLAQLNDSDDLAVVTLPAGQIVVEGEIAGRAKIIPFVAREDEVRRVEALGPALRVRPFVPLRVAALVHENVDEGALEKFRASLSEKLRFFGSPAPLVSQVPGDLAEALRRCIADGAQLVIMAGSKMMDPLDPVMNALQRAGSRVEKRGVPLNPGMLLWVASVDGVQVVGAPGCALVSRPTAFDVLLARLLTGERLTRAVLAGLGEGGLLTRETAFRLPPYRPGAARGELAP